MQTQKNIQKNKHKIQPVSKYIRATRIQHTINIMSQIYTVPKSDKVVHNQPIILIVNNIVLIPKALLEIITLNDLVICSINYNPYL